MSDVVLTALRLDELTSRQLLGVLRLRAEVFVVEQRCPYQDPDATDAVAWHLLMTAGGDVEGTTAPLLAYLRWWDEDDGAHIGRVVTAAAVRGRGLGHRLLGDALARIGPRRVVLHAQDHLRRFYEAHGFAAEGAVFLEDDIPHVTMVREAPPPAPSPPPSPPSR